MNTTINRSTTVSPLMMEPYVKVNTIDLRGHEQICTRKEAEQFAALHGYSMYYFGYSNEPSDVDSTLANEPFDNNRLLSTKQLKHFKDKYQIK